MTSITDIAAALRDHSPGVLTESVVIVTGTILAMRHTPVRETDGGISYSVVILPDDIAEAVLIAAMVQDANLHRMPTSWLDARVGGSHCFDADHGGSLGACYAAWCWSKGIACDTHPSA